MYTRRIAATATADSQSVLRQSRFLSEASVKISSSYPNARNRLLSGSSLPKRSRRTRPWNVLRDGLRFLAGERESFLSNNAILTLDGWEDRGFGTEAEKFVRSTGRSGRDRCSLGDGGTTVTSRRFTRVIHGIARGSMQETTELIVVLYIANRRFD